jgi:galactose-1-phosphate uridylyltransferase
MTNQWVIYAPSRENRPTAVSFQKMVKMIYIF